MGPDREPPDSQSRRDLFRSDGAGVARDPGRSLDEVCGPDPELRQRVERLLEVQPRVGSFLDSPAAGPTMTLPSARCSKAPER